MTAFFYETNGGNSGYIQAETIEQARQIFFADHPETAPDCVGIWEPEDPEYPV